MHYIELGFWYDEWHEIISSGKSNWIASEYCRNFSMFDDSDYRNRTFSPLVF